MEKELISIIVPCHNEGERIGVVVQHAFANTSDTVAIEVLVVDSMSEDNTHEVLNNLTNAFHQLRVLDNESRKKHKAFNIGLQAAEGNYVLFIDNNTELAPNYASECLAQLQEQTELRCVGGQLNHVYHDDESQAIAAVMASPFSVGGANWRMQREGGYVDTLTAPFYPKSIFNELGHFDESLLHHLDDEFNSRIAKANHKIWLTQKTSLKYNVKAKFSNLFEQYYEFGYWQVYVSQKHKAIRSKRQLIPGILLFILTFGFALSFLFSAVLKVYVLIFAIYFLLAMLFTTQTSVASSLKPKVLMSFFIMHFAYGCGSWMGVFDFFLLRKKPGKENKAIST